jgi:hypothetical protein
VDDTRILKDNDENRELQRMIREEHAKAAKKREKKGMTLILCFQYVNVCSADVNKFNKKRKFENGVYEKVSIHFMTLFATHNQYLG